jgi:hypothetical protein
MKITTEPRNGIAIKFALGNPKHHGTITVTQQKGGRLHYSLNLSSTELEPMGALHDLAGDILAKLPDFGCIGDVMRAVAAMTPELQSKVHAS